MDEVWQRLRSNNRFLIPFSTVAFVLQISLSIFQSLNLLNEGKKLVHHRNWKDFHILFNFTDKIAHCFVVFSDFVGILQDFLVGESTQGSNLNQSLPQNQVY